jgi:SNF2 family DNA or RNA helicase
MKRTNDTVSYARFLTNNAEDAREIGKVLSSSLSDVMLRRLKRDVLRSKTRVTTYHGDLTREENREYQYLYSQGVEKCNGVGGSSDVQVITLMMRLRQVCSSGSWKFETLGEHVATLPRGTKSLIFCTFRDEIKKVMETLCGSVDVLMEYHGGVPFKERQQMIEAFREQTYRSVVMVMQIDCGGTGLNLEDAQHVFIMSPTWSPCTERQAIGRADRATTRHTVNVHRYVTRKTIESYMCNRQLTKDNVTELLLMEKTNDIRGELVDSKGLLQSNWDDLCDIDTLFAM